MIGGLAAVAGTSLGVKAVAAALILVPTVALGANRLDMSATSHRLVVAAIALVLVATGAL